MFVKPFGYLRAETVEEAAATLRERGPSSKVLAGGQSLVPLINLGLVQADVLIDISRIPGLDSIERRDGSLSIGATVRHAAIESSTEIRTLQPLLSAAVSHVGNPRVRHRGTIGGSLVHADPAAEVPLVMAVLEAAYEVSDGVRFRQIAAIDFPVTFYTTALAESELLLSASIPILPVGWGWGFHEVSRRAGDFALVAAAAVARCEGGIVHEVRVGLGASGDRPLRCRAFEAGAVGKSSAQLAEIEETIGSDITFPTDINASSEYRARVARVLAMRAVLDACRRSEEGGPS